MSFIVSVPRLLRPALTRGGRRASATETSVRRLPPATEPRRQDPYYEMYLSSAASLIQRLHA